MPYSPLIVNPMRQELASIGFEDLMTADAVDTFMNEKRPQPFWLSIPSAVAPPARPVRV